MTDHDRGGQSAPHCGMQGAGMRAPCCQPTAILMRPAWLSYTGHMVRREFKCRRGTAPGLSWDVCLKTASTYPVTTAWVGVDVQSGRPIKSGLNLNRQAQGAAPRGASTSLALFRCVHERAIEQ
eukprot:2006200-Rhodomonas_salina.4